MIKIMERKERIYELMLEMKAGAETRNLDRVQTANEEFSQLCDILRWLKPTAS